MVTFKPVIASRQKRQDNTYNIKIRVTFKGVSRFLATTLDVTPNEITRNCKLKQGGKMNQSLELIRKMQEAIADITPFQLEGKDVDFVVGIIKDRLQERTFALDFFAYADEYIKTKQPTTRNAYVSALNALEQFIGKRVLDINAITKAFLIEFREYVDARPKQYYNKHIKALVSASTMGNGGQGSRHIMRLATIFKSAKDRYNDEDTGRILIPRSPFDNIKLVRPATNGQHSLDFGKLYLILNAYPEDKSERVALSAFCLSFFLMGANLADLYNAMPPVNGIWTYNRQKTESRRADHAKMIVPVPEECEPYIDILKGKGNKYWLNELRSFAPESQVTGKVNYNIRKWAKSQEIEDITFYAGRHTWATMARKAGVDKATIDECLAHVGSLQITDIYIEKDWQILADANRKVIDYVFGKFKVNS